MSCCQLQLCIECDQVDALLGTLRQVDIKLQGRGLSLAELGIALPPTEMHANMPRRSSGSVPIVAGMGSLSRTSYGSSYTPQSPRFLSGSSPTRGSNINHFFSPGAGSQGAGVGSGRTYSRPTSGSGPQHQAYAPRTSGSGSVSGPGSSTGLEGAGSKGAPVPTEQSPK